VVKSEFSTLIPLPIFSASFVLIAALLRTVVLMEDLKYTPMPSFKNLLFSRMQFLQLSSLTPDVSFAAPLIVSPLITKFILLVAEITLLLMELEAITVSSGFPDADIITRLLALVISIFSLYVPGYTIIVSPLVFALFTAAWIEPPG